MIALSPVYVWLIAITALPHKEERFMYVIYPLVWSQLLHLFVIRVGDIEQVLAYKFTCGCVVSGNQDSPYIEPEDNQVGFVHVMFSYFPCLSLGKPVWGH